jgi:NAD(P)H dehydrogenase (quinone)
MILVTAGTSQFGQATIDFLLKKGVPASEITAQVRDTARAQSLGSKGINLVKADYRDYSSLVNAFAGIDKMLFISSGEIAGRSEQHQNVVNAAKEAGVKHVIYTGVLTTNETGTSAIAMVSESHIKTEAWLKSSGLAYTIMKNTVYMDMLPMFIGEASIETGTIYLPAGDGKSSYVLRSEMAEAAANILTSEGHEGKIYPITSEKTWSYHDIAAILTGILGKEIKYVSPTPEEYGQVLADAKVPAEYIGMFTGFSLAKAKGELSTTDGTLSRLLGRNPTDVKTFLKQVYGK